MPTTDADGFTPRPEGSSRSAAARLLVIIPTLNEAEVLPATLDAVQQESGVLCIVSDGGSTDGTVDLASERRAQVITTPPGRAQQMNAGAQASTDDRDLLLFLHADTLLPAGYAEAIAGALEQPGVAAGAFAFATDGRGVAYRLMERIVHKRSTALQCPYGDQGLFMTTATFRQVGGFADLPVMEDVDIVTRLRRLGRIAIADRPAITSARRWQRHGFLRTSATHTAMMLAYKAGVSTHRIADWRSTSA